MGRNLWQKERKELFRSLVGQENIIKELREEVARLKQADANTKWVEHDDKSLRL